MSVTAIVYTTAAWILLLLFPKLFISIFNTDPELVERAIPSLTMYFFGFFMMSLQMAGQATFVGLGRAKSAIFFSIFRKVVIVVPLTLLLPRLWELGVKGVFLAEPVSNWIGGAACFITMMLTVYTKLPADRQPETVPDSDT
jgi:Na+-driven multidrug efflux pump